MEEEMLEEEEEEEMVGDSGCQTSIVFPRAVHCTVYNPRIKTICLSKDIWSRFKQITNEQKLTYVGFFPTFPHNPVFVHNVIANLSLQHRHFLFCTPAQKVNPFLAKTKKLAENKEKVGKEKEQRKRKKKQRKVKKKKSHLQPPHLSSHREDLTRFNFL